MRIAITGVTGFIGRHLATRALARGHDVTAFSRRPWTARRTCRSPTGTSSSCPARPEPGALDGVDAVVHLAIAAQSAPDAVIDAVNRLGTERLFEAAKRAGVERFVFVSSQSAHAGVDSAYGRSKHAVEQALRGRARASSSCGRAWSTATPTSGSSPGRRAPRRSSACSR